MRVQRAKLLSDLADKLVAVAGDLRVLADSAQVDEPTKADGLTEEVTKPTEAISLETVRGVLADKSRNGHTLEVRAIIQRYGANRLSEVDPKFYPDVLREAEVL